MKHKISKSFYFVSSLFILLTLIGAFFINDPNFQSPTNSKYINDYSNIVSTSTKDSIISLGKELQDKTTAEEVVIIINSTNGIPIEEYANKIFRSWGIGSKEKDNGLLILIAIDDKAWRIEVGRGLEGIIPDALSNRIMELYAKPYFQNNDYNTGIINAYNSFANKIAEEYNVTLSGNLNIKSTSNNSSINNSKYIGIIIFILILLDLILNRGRIISTIIQIMFISNFTGRGPRGGNNNGGFGGGNSNGGGSSGNW